MSTIHQIYCTHCTHGTSALERREGELADRMLGYSARAGSLEARELRRYYREIERYVYYYLPRDTPSEDKLKLTASLAARRLVYHPSAAGMQVIAQVCYRQTDTQGRPGSYFAHVLFRDQRDNQPAWSPLDCLKLWAAPGWVEEDSASLPFLLHPLGSLGQLLLGRRPAIDDHVFLSFLTTPAGGSFDDPAGVIPERWRRTGAGQRSGLFLEALAGFLEITGTRGESLLLVIEPSAAALVFYGVLRLLPAGAMREQVSFSTFEANTDRVGTSLAATTFHDPQKTDLRADAYRSKGFVINTFSGRRSERRRSEAPYAQSMVRRLVEEGWSAVDSVLADMESAGARRTEDLDALAAVDLLVSVLLDPRHPPVSDDWRRSPMIRQYLRQALARRLGRQVNPIAVLEPIVGKPAHLAILDLIATEPAMPGTRAVADFLLDKLPGDRITALLKLDGVSSEAKVEALARYVGAHGDLPPGCDHLWSEAARPPGPRAQGGMAATGGTPVPLASPGPRAHEGMAATGGTPVPLALLAARAQGEMPLIGKLLARLDANTLEGFYRQVAAQHSDVFLIRLFGAWKCERVPRETLGRIVQAADDRALLSLFRTQGAVFFKEYPEDDPALGAKLGQMLRSLVEHAHQFPERLEVIVAGRRLLPDADQDYVTAWVNVQRSVLEVGRLQEEKSGVLRQPPLNALEAACRRMAEEARKAMPLNRLDDDAQASRKQAALRQIGHRLLDGQALLPEGPWQHDALWQKIAWYFRNRTWPSAPLRKMCPKSRSLRPLGLFLITLAMVTLLMVAANALLFSRRDEPAGVALTEGPEPPKVEASGIGTGTAPPRPAATEPREGPESPQATQPAPLPGPAEKTPETPASGVPIEEPPPQRAAAEPVGPKPEIGEPATGQSDPTEKSAAGETIAPHVLPDHEPREGTPPADENDWKARAEQFAREHAGRFFDERPLADGKLRIPADALPAGDDAGALFLGGGVLYFDRAVAPFGHGFDQRAPVSRHEVPGAAQAFRLPSVYVELQAQPGGYAVVLGAVPNSLPADAEARKDELLEQAERNARMVRAQLRTYHSRTATEEERAQAFDTLVKLMEIELPAVSPRPDRHSPEFRENPKAYEAALEVRERAIAARDRAKNSVLPKAKEYAASADQRQRSAESQFRQYEEQVRRQNEQALRALREQCRRISVLVYRVPASGEAAGPSTAAAPAADGPAGVPASADRSVDSVDGRFQVDARLAQGLNPPAVARICPLVTGEGGKPLPGWFHDVIVTGCTISQRNAAGLLLRTIRLQDVAVEKNAEVFEPAVAAGVRFMFSRRADRSAVAPQNVAIATASHTIEQIDRGKQYNVGLQLTKETLDWLRLLAAPADPSEP